MRITRVGRRVGAVLGAALVIGVTTLWVGGVIEAVVWVVGTASANVAIQHGGLSCGDVSALVSAGSEGLIEPLDSRWIVDGAVLCGYSRHDGSDPLDHEMRERIHELVESDPGVFLSELAGRLDVSLSTVRYHVRVLEEESVLTSRKINGKRRYYPVDIDDPTLVAALGESSTAAVLDALARLGPMTGSELADALDRDPSTVSHHLTRLADVGLIEREQRGRTVVSRLSPDVEATLV